MTKYCPNDDSSMSNWEHHTFPELALPQMTKMSFFRNRYSLQNPSNTELLMAEYKKSVKQKIVDAIKDLQVCIE